MPIETTNEIFRLYLLALLVGETIQGAPIKGATVWEYLKAASTYLQAVGNRQESAIIDPLTGKTYKPISDAIRDYEKWESMPKKQSPLTKKMILNLIERTKDYHIDSKERAFVDWCILGLHMAYRRIEWCNEWNPKSLEDFHRAKDIHKLIYHCLVQDLQLLGADGNFLSESAQLTYNPGLLTHAKVKVRFQKNGRNGEILSVAANVPQPTFCGARVAQRIKQRAQRLGLDPHQPASAYRSNPGSKRPSFFHRKLVQTILESTAKSTYQVDDLKKHNLSYTPHSIRIGAVVIMHCGGAHEHDIKFKLRYVTTAFMAYLRDVPATAINQIRLINATDVDSWDIILTLADPVE
jgi:hypothetical protein